MKAELSNFLSLYICLIIFAHISIWLYGPMNREKKRLESATKTNTERTGEKQCVRIYRIRTLATHINMWEKMR